jgi:hypothetical protein
VHELHTLLGGRSQNILVLVNLDLDTDRFETDDMLVTHVIAFRFDGPGQLGWAGPEEPARLPQEP